MIQMDDPKFIDVGGIRTRYFEAGRGDDLVLIHGGGFGSMDSAYHWSRNFDALSRHFHVVAFDKLGQGHTDNPATDDGYTMSSVIDHCRDFMRAVGVHQAAVVGHSRGALPAARIAMDDPELVGALIILDTNTLAPDHPSTPTDFYQRLESDPSEAATAESVRREPDANSFTTDHVTPDLVDAMLEIARLPKTRDATERVRRVRRDVFLPDIVRQKHMALDLIRDGRLRQPTLIVWGLNDRSAPIGVGYQLFHHVGMSVPSVQLHVFNRAAHYAFRERADEFDRLVIDFLGGAKGRTDAEPRR